MGEDGFADLAGRYNFDFSNIHHQRRAAEEFLAGVAEKLDMGKALEPDERKLWDRLLDFVRTLARKLGHDAELTDAEILRVVKNSMRWVFEGEAGGKAGGGTRWSLERHIRFLQSDFGPQYRQFRNQPEKALEHLLKERQGEALAAFVHPVVGDIDFVWGKGGEQGYGLAHIIEKHGEGIVNEIPRILREGRTISKEHVPGRVYFITDKELAVVRLDWDGRSKKWLVTAYEPDGDPRPGSTTDLARPEGGEQVVPSPHGGKDNITPDTDDGNGGGALSG